MIVSINSLPKSLALRQSRYKTALDLFFLYIFLTLPIVITMNKFIFPSIVRELVIVRNKMRDHYAEYDRTFTLDGNLIGDLGEVIAADIFGIKLIPRNGTGIDGHSPTGRSVQIKASGTRGAPAWRCVDIRADHLLFFHLDLEACIADLIFNGPENLVTSSLNPPWVGQKKVSLSKIRKANASVIEEERLQPITDKYNFSI